MISEGFHIWYQEFWNKFDKREKKWEMHEKKLTSKSIKMCLKLPTEKKILAKDAYNKIGPESHSSKKSHIKRTSKIILNRKDRKKNGKFFNKNNEERSWNEKY